MRKINKFYSSLAEASKAAKNLGITSKPNYILSYSQDPRLPSKPHKSYPNEWVDWYHFLGKTRPTVKYLTLSEASKAAIGLGVSSSREYENRYRKDPKLPSRPKDFYSDTWKGWSNFLGLKKGIDKYGTIIEAKIATKAIGFTNSKEYQLKYKLDPRLPSNPQIYYAREWRGWQYFLSHIEKYDSIHEASLSAQCFGWVKGQEYKANYKKDPRLPANPEQYYKSEWMNWYDFLGQKKPQKKYKTLAEASLAAKRLRIYNMTQYLLDYRKNPRLPSNPERSYPNDWVNWYSFLGAVSPKEKYHTITEASKAAKLFGFKTGSEYKLGCYNDPLLPSNPNRHYKNEWVSWHDFLGTEVPKQKYSTLIEATIAVQKLKILTYNDYQKNYHKNKHLPANPEQFYFNEWTTWYEFLGTKPPETKYLSLAEAKTATVSLNIKTVNEYKEKYSQDPRLTFNPNIQYSDDWKGWVNFLLPCEYNSLEDIKHAIKLIKIKNSKEYRLKYKKYPPLPANPQRVFKSEWIDWYDLCDIPRPYSYDKAKSIASSANINSQVQYRKFVIESNDAKLPRNPDRVYKENWINWFVFLGKEEPFKTEYIREPYLKWKEAIDEFMKTARGGGSKQSNLCLFVRLYIQCNKFGYSPEDFLTYKDVNIKKFQELLQRQYSDNKRRSLLVAVNEFLEYVIRTKLTIEDEETGELCTISNAKNPLVNITLQNNEPKKVYGESSKPALAYQYVEASRRWMIPEQSKTFSDLNHLQNFDADWVEVNPKLLDKTDPDCIWKKEGNKTKLWFPIYWLHTYTLVSIPARGRQIAYNDSGEGDEWQPHIKNKNLVWRKNKNPLANSTNQQGFIKRYGDDQPGMHFTTNKTSNHGKGYDVPWIPTELVYWLIKLRNWQQKYNPISQPTSWLSCQRTSLNEIQRKLKGNNCFLFRDYGETEPGFFSGRLANRLAAALYYSQPQDLILAELKGSIHSLSCYKSRYTPHSMRVSLITAYVMEFGLPIEIIMKVAGHSSVLMSLYYTKANAEDLRHRFDKGEKKALKNKAYAAQRMIEQGRVDEIKHDLVGNSNQALKFITGDIPVGNFLFRDYGICPFAGTRCDDGGPLIGSSQIRLPTVSGYLGFQNCLRCRHFVTGPAFIGGLLSIGNEISLQAQLQFEQYSTLEEKSSELKLKIDILDDSAYDAEQLGQSFDDGEINQLRVERRKTKSESESAAKKLDILMCDIQANARLIKQCKALINEQSDKNKKNSKTQLVVHTDHELDLVIEDVSRFQQFSEICENAEIYESANADLAIAPRSQILDKMAELNKLNLRLYSLDKKQQLVVGNQITQLLLDRLKTWERVDLLVEGKICLQDLSADEQITRHDIQVVLKSNFKALQ